MEHDADLTFAPAINDRSMRMAISKELREVREDVPAAHRLSLRHPPKLTAGESSDSNQGTVAQSMVTVALCYMYHAIARHCYIAITTCLCTEMTCDAHAPDVWQQLFLHLAACVYSACHIAHCGTKLFCHMRHASDNVDALTILYMDHAVYYHAVYYHAAYSQRAYFDRSVHSQCTLTTLRNHNMQHCCGISNRVPVHAGVIEEEARCTFSPHINPASEQLLEDSLQVPANFYERQRFFYEMRQERMQRLQADSVSLPPILAYIKPHSTAVATLSLIMTMLPDQEGPSKPSAHVPSWFRAPQAKQCT